MSRSSWPFSMPMLPHPVEEHGLQVFGVLGGCVGFSSRRPGWSLRTGRQRHADREDDPPARPLSTLLPTKTLGWPSLSTLLTTRRIFGVEHARPGRARSRPMFGIGSRGGGFPARSARERVAVRPGPLDAFDAGTSSGASLRCQPHQAAPAGVAGRDRLSFPCSARE